MIRMVGSLCGILLSLLTPSMAQQDSVFLSREQIDSLEYVEQVAAAWLKIQTTSGVQMDSGRIVFDDEARRLIADSAYAASVYPDTIGADQFRDAVAEMNLRRAFYYLIDLYDAHPNEMMAILMAYDRIIPVEKVLRASFYTYAFLDPAITTIVNGRPEITHPDIFDAKFRRTNSVIRAVMELRGRQPASPMDAVPSER